LPRTREREAPRRSAALEAHPQANARSVLARGAVRWALSTSSHAQNAARPVGCDAVPYGRPLGCSPAAAPEIAYPCPSHRKTFRLEQRPLQRCIAAISAETSRRRDDAVARHIAGPAGAHDVADGPRRTRPSRRRRDVAVRGHTARRNAPHGGEHPSPERGHGRTHVTCRSHCNLHGCHWNRSSSSGSRSRLGRARRGPPPSEQEPYPDADLRPAGTD
jgi:hypothetical protein